MIDKDALIQSLESMINEIVATITPELPPLVRVMQSGRARALMDMVDCLKECAIVDTDDKTV